MTASAQPDEAGQLLVAAERDRSALVILIRDPQAPVEIVLFLAQQAIEKTFKAVLAMHGVVYRRTHDLLLEALLRQAGLAPPVAHDLLARIGPYAVEFRYSASPAPVVALAEAQAAVHSAMTWSAAVVGSAI
jgi:hypothetical protein